MKGDTIFSGMQSRWAGALAGVVILAFSAGALSDDAKPCAADAAKFCKGIEPGEGRIAKCMKEHENELSPACKARISEFKEEVKEFAEACKGDAEKNCKGVKPGGGRILQCLKAHESSLSPQCREKMGEAKGKRQRG
jgi:hypothetical protein